MARWPPPTLHGPARPSRDGGRAVDRRCSRWAAPGFTITKKAYRQQQCSSAAGRRNGILLRPVRAPATTVRGSRSVLRALRLDVLSLYPRPGAGRFAAWGWLGRALWRALAAGGLTATGGTRRSRMLSQVLVAIIGMFLMGGIVYSAWGGGALCTAFPLRAAGNWLCALRLRRRQLRGDRGGRYGGAIGRRPVGRSLPAC